MAVTIRIADSGVKLPQLVDRFKEQAAAAVTAGVTGATEGLKLELRQQIEDAFPNSRRLPTTIGSRVYSGGGNSLRAAGVITPRQGAGAILLAQSNGVTIKPAKGKTLAIPTASVPRQSGRRLTVAQVETRFGKLVWAPPAKRGGKSVGRLVLPGYVPGAGGRVRRKRGAKAQRLPDVTMFILVRQTTLPKRLNPEAVAERWAGLVPGLIDRAAGALK